MPSTIVPGVPLAPDFIPATGIPTALTLKGMQQAASANVSTPTNGGTLNVGPAPFDGTTLFHFAGNSNGTLIATNGPQAFAGALADFQVGGASVLFVSGGKKVGINTQSPTNALTVAATAAGDGFAVTGNSGTGIAPQFSLYDSATQVAAFGFAAVAGQYSLAAAAHDVTLRCTSTIGAKLIFTNQTGSDIIFATGVDGRGDDDTEKARLTNAGFFGVGTSAGNLPQSTLESRGSLGVNGGRITTGYTAGAGDCIIVANAANLTVTLPAATTCRNRLYIVKNGPSFSGTTTVNGGGTNIDGAATVTFTAAFGSLRIWSDGIQWLTV